MIKIKNTQYQRRNQIQKVMNVDEGNVKAHMSISEPPVEMHIAEVNSRMKAELPLVSVYQEHQQRRDRLRSKLEQSYDPEKQWKINQTKWNERYGWEDKHTEGIARCSLRMRIWVSLLLFAVTYGMMTFPVEWNAPIRTWIVHSLTEEMDMRPLAAWYERTFSGTPVFIPLFPKGKEKTLPVQVQKWFHTPIKGKVVQPFAMNMKNIVIAPEHSGSLVVEVHNVATGRIEQVTTDMKEGTTITVRHADGLVTLYGGLASSSVQRGDWLEEGGTIGILQGGKEGVASRSVGALTFSIQRQGLYIDPSDVINFD